MGVAGHGYIGIGGGKVQERRTEGKEFFADGAVWADGELPPAPKLAKAESAVAETPVAKPASK